MSIRDAFIASLLGMFGYTSTAYANSCSNVDVIGSFDESGLRESEFGIYAAGTFRIEGEGDEGKQPMFNLATINCEKQLDDRGRASLECKVTQAVELATTCSERRSVSTRPPTTALARRRGLFRDGREARQAERSVREGTTASLRWLGSALAPKRGRPDADIAKALSVPGRCSNLFHQNDKEEDRERHGAGHSRYRADRRFFNPNTAPLLDAQRPEILDKRHVMRLQCGTQ